MHVLVTGGAGFIGSHIVEALVAEGHRVRVLDNLSTGRLSNLEAVGSEIDFMQGDLRDEAILGRATANIDAMLHLAAMVSVPQSIAEPIEAERINSLGTLQLLQAAKSNGVRRVVLSSTCAVYGDEPTLPKTEAMLPVPKSPYAIAKLAAEQYCLFFAQMHGVEAVVLRYFNVFGPRQDPSSPYSGVISIFADRMSRRVPLTIFGDGEQTRDFVYAGDVARANLAAMELPAANGQILNIGTGRPVTINTLFRELAHLLDYSLDPTYKPPRKGDILHSYADASRANTVLTWHPEITFEAGLKRLVDSL